MVDLKGVLVLIARQFLRRSQIKSNFHIAWYYDSTSFYSNYSGINYYYQKHFPIKLQKMPRANWEANPYKNPHLL